MEKLKDFLNFFGYTYEKKEDKYGYQIYNVFCLQGIDEYLMEGKEFSMPMDIVREFEACIFTHNYMNKKLKEDGYDFNQSQDDEFEWNDKYKWCIENNISYADICYELLCAHNRNNL